MADPVDTLQPVVPGEVLREIAEAMPADCLQNVIIVGSLAVGYHYFQDRASMVVRTKDTDCLLSPRVAVIPAGKAVTEKLMDEGWRFRESEEWGQPGNATTPVGSLPAVRLHPPEHSDWFIELLAVPESPAEREMRHVRLVTRHGHFSLISFGFLSLNSYRPLQTVLGVYIARPEMMALANLLEHPEIVSTPMSRGFAGRADIKRSNKDLGRVLAIARLATRRDEDVLLEWPPLWKDALQDRFPDDWRELAGRTGQGLRALLNSEPDLEQAVYTCINGLLASDPPSITGLQIAGQRLLQDAVEPLETAAEAG